VGNDLNITGVEADVRECICVFWLGITWFGVSLFPTLGGFYS